jgi:heterotetrameric sarcosine oxidase gamma subunit
MTRKERAFVVDVSAMQSPVNDSRMEIGSVVLTDESAQYKWRTWVDPGGVALGRCRHVSDDLVLAVAPNEWIVIGHEPAGDVVDLTHARAMIRVTGLSARYLLTHVCALDLGDLMTPDGSAARTLVAGVPTELVRDDAEGDPAYLLLMSRSFARSVWDRLVDVAGRL